MRIVDVAGRLPGLHRPCVYPEEPEPDTLDQLVSIMRQDEVDITISLGLGDATATVYGCDLSEGYIRVNADYTS